MIDPRTAPYGLFLLRVSLGVMFIAHAALKVFVFTVPGFAGFLAQVGLPSFMALPVIAAEIVGGLALVLGVYSRLVGVLLLPVLLGALMVHSGNGWLFTAANGGWEYPAFLVLATVTLILGGDGAFALRPTPTSFAPRLAAQTA
ncbi:DoxX family protein [Alsobacter sp. KACC 23698]|uniref:DoxX family protein n=1 Tax=Alsobacter sp. KACC 23698 TaxID=3149229 RepID=A0AAU7JJJ9_9HYPH